MVAQPSASPLWFEVLGPVRGRREGLDLDLGSGKQRAVLAVLLLHRNTPVTNARIVEAVWGDDPPLNGANVVQKYVAGLRRTLEPAREARAPGHLLSLDAAGYTLAVGPDQLDLEAFDRLRRSGLRHRAEGRTELALRTLRDAADLVVAEPLAGLPGDWFAAARARIVEDWTDTLEACVELEVEAGRAEQALPEIRGLVARFPLRERLRGALMLALYRSGRPAEALAAFQATRDDLVETLGVEPGPALQDLHARMLRGDPSLGGPAVGGPSPGGPAVGAGPGGTASGGAAAGGGGAVPGPPRLTLVPNGAESGGPGADLGAADADVAPPSSRVPLPPPYVVPSGPVGPPPVQRAVRPPRRRPAWATTVLAALSILTTLGSLGLAAPFVAVTVGAASWAGGRRRAAYAAAGLCVVWAVGFALVGASPDTDPVGNVGIAIVFLSAFAILGLALHALFRRPAPAA